jgi:hypothetical protein
MKRGMKRPPKHKKTPSLERSAPLSPGNFHARKKTGTRV